MKAVVLLAGKGRRMNDVETKHKSLTMLGENSLLYHLIKNIEKANIKEIIPVVGYHGEYVLDEIKRSKSDNLIVSPAWNFDYENTNNLFSLYQTREMLEDEDFISINGDMIFDYRILTEIMKKDGSQIAVDDNDYNLPVDSPGVIVENGKIIDLGRHISFEQKDGYAVGIYRYSKELSVDFFAEAERMLKRNKNAGFHDPLVKLFTKHFITICSVKNYLWTDIDEEKDIKKAKEILRRLNICN